MKAKKVDDTLVLTLTDQGAIELEDTQACYPFEFHTDEVMYEFFEGFIANTEWEWINPVEVSALTSAPLLGIRDENGQVLECYGFMEYALRSILEDLNKNGQVVLQKG